jgi:N6-adenosine-specific RNA methylase IME4
MRTWGFQFKTGGPWIKRAGNGNSAMGTGYVLRSAAELFLIRTLGAGPYLELFARTQRPGWTVWGKQTNKSSKAAAAS